MNIHQDQGIVERFDRNLVELLFTLQYSQEIKEASRNFSALNCEMTRSTVKRPVDTIKEKAADAKSSTTCSRPILTKSLKM